MKLKLQVTIKKLLFQARIGLKSKLKDPYMCNCAKNTIDDIVDEKWPEVEDLVYIQLGMKNELHYQHKERPPAGCCKYNPLVYLRAWYLYTVDPFDRTVWYKLRNVCWWVLLLISIFPWYSVQIYFYVFRFLMIDKSDEWQLINFVLNFKASQFITLGVFNSIIGYVQFYSCSTINDYTSISEATKCQENGPWSGINDYVALLIQILLV